MAKSRSPRVSGKIKQAMLEKMLLIRRFEEKAAVMYGLRKIGGFCHLYIGQEAVAVGAIQALDLKKDYVITAYRDHGHGLACGMDPGACMAELFYKETGCSRGKGGSMHFFDRDRHMLGGNGIVGAQTPTGLGVAFKIKYNEEKAVCLCFFGDGAAHQGSLHESMNMAKVWGLPVVYVCENNHYGMGTAAHRVSAETDFSKIGASHNIEGEQVDGMDVLEVYDVFDRVCRKLRKEPGPYVIETKTYRYKGHSMSDPARYRSKEEVRKYQENDPIERLKTNMGRARQLKQEDFDKLDEKIKKQVEKAVEFAEESDHPALETRFEDVLV